MFNMNITICNNAPLHLPSVLLLLVAEVSFLVCAITHIFHTVPKLLNCTVFEKLPFQTKNGEKSYNVKYTINLTEKSYKNYTV